MKYEAIIYDLDGTLIDSKKDIANTTNATIIKLGGLPLADTTIYKCVGGGVRELVKQAMPHHPEDIFAEALDYFDTHYHEHCLDETRLYPGAQNVLDELSILGIRQAIFTNKPQSFTDKILAGLELEHLFHVVVGAHSGFPHKPERAGTDYILEQLGTSPEKTLMVGDSIVDLHTAQNVGMDCVLMMDGFTAREEILLLKNEVVCLCETFVDFRTFLQV